MEQLQIRDVANPGLIRPPLVFSLGVVLGFLLDAIFPLRIPLGSFAAPSAVLLFVVGLVLFLYTRHEFRKAGTPIPGNLPATKLIQQGPFSLSRNPMYLAFSIFHLAISVWFGSVWMFMTLLAALFVISKVVIPREERFMMNKFGAEFALYKSVTRRWI